MFFVALPIACCNLQTAFGQDIHFSQFYASPFNINPALTGQFDGDYRFIMNQRTQWRSVTIPYNTWGLSVDSKDLAIPIGGMPALKNTGLGLSFFTDKTGDSKLKTSTLQLASSYLVELEKGKPHFISPGVQLGVAGTSIDYTALRFDNQWNGFVYDPGIDAGENFARNARTYFTMALGIAYFHKPDARHQVEAGISFFNINNSRQSWFDNSAVKLDQRLNIHAQCKFPIHEVVDLEPALLFMTQGTYREFDIGARGNYILLNEKRLYRSVYAGIFYRTKDAGFLVGGIRYDQWNVGVSYDINTSGLRPASHGRGGFEFSIIYLIKKPPFISRPPHTCPDFI